jgi:hypothetical protein
MRIRKWFPVSTVVCVLLCAAPMKGDSKNMADYPLRLRIFSKDSTTFYSMRNVDEQKGEGRADLFENGEPRGVDFNYSCDEKLKASFGYETYPAKWKKPGQVLTVLLPVFGKSNAYYTCNLNVAVKDSVYVRHNGALRSEAPEKYKAWMMKHDYDPEHGKNTPMNLTAADNADNPDAPPSAPPPAQP